MRPRGAASGLRPPTLRPRRPPSRRDGRGPRRSRAFPARVTRYALTRAPASPQVFHSGEALDWGMSLAGLCSSAAKDLERGLGRWEAQGRYMVVTYDELVSEPLATVRRVHEFMGVHYVEGGEPTGADAGMIRAETTLERVQEAIASHILESGGIGVGELHEQKYSSFGTTRSKVRCGACDDAVERDVDATALCREVVDRIGLKCCASAG